MSQGLIKLHHRFTHVQIVNQGSLNGPIFLPTPPPPVLNGSFGPSWHQASTEEECPQYPPHSPLMQDRLREGWALSVKDVLFFKVDRITVDEYGPSGTLVWEHL